MLYALQYFWDTITEEEYSLLEEAIFWSDLGKYHTTKESPKKVWEDGELKGNLLAPPLAMTRSLRNCMKKQEGLTLLYTLSLQNT